MGVGYGRRTASVVWAFKNGKRINECLANAAGASAPPSSGSGGHYQTVNHRGNAEPALKLRHAPARETRCL
jgi:hypothetical protein